MEAGTWKVHAQPAGPQFQRSVELRGHILDSLTFSEALDGILALGGDYYIQSIDVGHRKENPSRVCLVVGAPTEEQLQSILVRLQQLGANIPGCD